MTASSISSTSARTTDAGGRFVKLGHVLSALAMLLAAIAGWLAPPERRFEQRFVSMPPAMPLETFLTSRAAAKRPSFCQWNYFGSACRIS
jgi:hypothetical protein